MKSLRQMFSLLVMAAIMLMASPVFASDLQSDVLYFVNVERMAAGVQPLVSNSSLENGAAVRAQESSVCFAHQRPDGREVKSVLNGAAYSWFGENLAVSTTQDAQKIVRAWMGSPTHRANLLNRHFTQMGLSCVRGADGQLYWAQLLTSD